jgi:site-specific DNA-methyltransferase (adenine-specific)
MTNQTNVAATPLQPIVLPPFAPYYADEAVTIYNADCRQVLPFLPRFDLLLTDPPYGIGVGKMQMQAGAKRKEFSRFRWDDATPSQWVIDSQIEVASDAIIWGGNYFSVKPSRCWLTWDKIQEFSGSDFEAAWTTFDKPCKTFRMSRVEAHTNGKSHPTEKPLALIRWCMTFAPEAVTILDPFAGSGTTGVAAKLEGRKATLIEISEEYCEKAADRLRQGVLF